MLVKVNHLVKKNQLDQAARFALAYLREVFKEISYEQFSDVVHFAFYNSMFSFLIYTYKESHSGLWIPQSAYKLLDESQMQALNT